MLIPEMDTKSNLISDDQRKLLYRHLPPRIQVQVVAMTDCMIKTAMPFFGSV
jgi:hypothetical protein